MNTPRVGNHFYSLHLNMKSKFSFFFLLVLSLSGAAQDYRIKVFAEDRYEYNCPWAGGMNNCQFGKIDLDLNNTVDLVVFDRVGDRIMPFRVVRSSDEMDYRYAPEFESSFPELHQWAIFEDYNLDGKTDIFTYSPGYAGMKVYRNVSEDHLEFRLEVAPFLKSFQGGGYVNILVTYADYPAITDLDGDGDLDILTFWGLGSFVEKHRNLSVEKYGHADSLDYEKTEFCWGFFAESEETNAITLDTCLRCLENAPTTDRHTGSTFRILNLNGDALPDLLLGDVDYPNLIALYNGGTIDTARMTTYEWQYPSGDQTVNLFTMPAAFYDDFDFDGIKDLLVSPFDPNPFLPENLHSNWLYHNSGTNDQPQFSLKTQSFLQNRMLDFGAGAYPVLFDIDQDGLTDLMIGNYGYYDTSYFDEFLILHTEQTGQIAYLKNTGSSLQPSFTLVSSDLAGLASLHLKGVLPAFGDLDGDGDPDLLAGCENGQIIYCENVSGQPGEPSFVISDENYFMLDVGDYSAPQLFDLDGDGPIDLIIGEKGGNLNYYRNTGTLQAPSFTLVTDSLGGISVIDPDVSLDGFSVPYFFKDADEQLHLLVGSEQGEVYYFTGIEGNLDGEFILNDTLAGLIGINSLNDDYGFRAAAALGDLNQDGSPELIAGNFSGGLNYLSKQPESPVDHVPDDDQPENVTVTIFPNPAHDKIFLIFDEILHQVEVEIILYNSSGQPIYSYTGSPGASMTIPTDKYPGGIYFLQFIYHKQLKNPFIESKRIILIK